MKRMWAPICIFIGGMETNTVGCLVGLVLVPFIFLLGLVLLRLLLPMLLHKLGILKSGLFRVTRQNYGEDKMQLISLKFPLTVAIAIYSSD